MSKTNTVTRDEAISMLSGYDAAVLVRTGSVFADKRHYRLLTDTKRVVVTDYNKETK